MRTEVIMMPHSPSFSARLFMIFVFGSLGSHATAQAVPAPAPTWHPGGVARQPQPRQAPCWEVAGISKSAMEQRRAIQERTRSEVEAVCSDPSLSQQERQQRIRQIHEQAKQELDALTTPQQMEELKSCQMSRNHGGIHPGAGHPSTGGHGPCGDLPSKSIPNPPPGNKPEPEIEN